MTTTPLFKRSPGFLPTLWVFALIAPAAAIGGAIEPASFEASIDLRETITIDKTVYVDPDSPADLVDVFFLFDNTGSTEPIIRAVKRASARLLDRIAGGDPRFAGIDVGFGVGRYLRDPGEGVHPRRSYQLQQPITTYTGAALAAINAWRLGSGGDDPEGNFFALHQVATQGAPTDGVGRSDRGMGTGQATGWRANSGRIIVWFGDAPAHESTVDLREVVDALVDSNVIVAALNTKRAGRGIDYDGQASAIASATGGTLTNGISTAGITDFILDVVASALSARVIDLTLATSGDTSGLDISFSCTSPQGCDKVKPGESRDFRMTVTGVRLGDFAFTTFAPGVAGAEERDRISVLPGGLPIVDSTPGGRCRRSICVCANYHLFRAATVKQAKPSAGRRAAARYPIPRISVLAFAFALAVGVAGAGSIDPSTFEASIDVRETIEIDKTVYVSDIAPEHALHDMVDVFFLFDNTGSTEPIIYSVKRAGRQILDRIGGSDRRFQGIDVGFGVGRYLGDPGEGNSAFRSYQLQQPITTSRAAAEAAIHGWYVDGRGNFDVPEGNLFALH